MSLADLQTWYRQAMEGLTFLLADPVVRTVKLSHPAAYYSTHINGGEPKLWFWNNVLDDALPLTGGGELGKNVRLFYVDADTTCPQTTGGSLGIAVLPANDLRGLIGEPTKTICEEDRQFLVNRYIGGSGHELGHAFGLDHPPGCDKVPPAGDTQALMCSGYVDYPQTHLTQSDIDSLRQSPFFH